MFTVKLTFIDVQNCKTADYEFIAQEKIGRHCRKK